MAGAGRSLGVAALERCGSSRGALSRVAALFDGVALFSAALALATGERGAAAAAFTGVACF
jgi:hypothetical protein